MDDSIAEGWVTNEELAAWLKLVESHIPKIENPKPTTALPEPPDSPMDRLAFFAVNNGDLKITVSEGFVIDRL